MRKEPNYRTEILVKFAKNISVFKTSIENKNSKSWTASQKYRVIKQGLFLHTVQKVRDLEPEMRSKLNV